MMSDYIRTEARKILHHLPSDDCAKVLEYMTQQVNQAEAKGKRQARAYVRVMEVGLLALALSIPIILGSWIYADSFSRAEEANETARKMRVQVKALEVKCIDKVICECEE